MASTTERQQIDSEGIHVRDCYVSAEISYLDSRSDFREYLLQEGQLKATRDRSVMSDSPAEILRSAGDPGYGSSIVDALAGLTIVAIMILTVGFFYTLVNV